MRVILTRQPAQAGALEVGLEQLGYQPEFLPLTDFALPEDTTDLCQLVEKIHQGAFAWLVLTSPNTVRTLRRCGWLPELTTPHTRIAVTGPGTARVINESVPRAAGENRSSVWMPEGDASAAGIIAQIPDGDQRALALPQSGAASDDLRQSLVDKGWAVHKVVAYETVPYPAEEHRNILPVESEPNALTVTDLTGAEVVVITSSSAATQFARKGFQSTSSLRLIAIGEPTARRMMAEGLRVAKTAHSPDAEGIHRAITRVLQEDDTP